MPVSIVSSNDNGYGDNTVVWVPNNIDPNDDYTWPNPGADDPWTVTIAKFLTNGVAGSFTYTTTIFDPSVPGADYQPAIVTGPATPALNQNNAYTFTAVPNATGYEWLSALVQATNLFDNAQKGLVNFTASVDPAYFPITNSPDGSGSNVFYLTDTFWTNFSEAPPNQMLTLNQTIEPTVSTRFSFLSDQEYTAGLNCNVEVSADGVTWNAVYSQPGIANSQGSYSLQTASLSSYIGVPVQIRFNLTYVPGQEYYEDFWPVGWFINNITLSNYLAVGSQVTNVVSSGLGFNFDPAAAGTYQLSVSPQYFGQYYSTFGPATNVAASASVSRPTLTFSSSGSNLMLMWPNSASNFVLQYKHLLTDASWQTIPGGVITSSGGLYDYTTSETNGSQFFRLEAP